MQPGDRVRLTLSDDVVTVTAVDERGMVHVRFDSGAEIAVSPTLIAEQP